MFWFGQRPEEGRADFEAAVQKHEVALAALEGDGAAPDVPGILAYIKGHQAWQDGVKAPYSKAQHRKCGYCEILFTDYGDVEHYRPKSAIYKLDERGTEVPDLNNVQGRSFGQPPASGTWPSGYWWLAYRWDNYLLACGVCNQRYKNALFPIKYGHRREPRRGDEAAKVPYLLDPFGDRDPAEHLEFSAAGGISAREGSRIGQETIDVCGLDRPSRVASRLEKARRVFRKLRQLAETDEADPAFAWILEDIAELGAEEYEHAGMVRAVWTQQTGSSWDELLALLSP